MKRKILSLCIIAAVLAISASGTLAFFTASENAQNVVSSGGIDVNIVERTANANGMLVNLPQEGLSGILPGDTVTLQVSVSNTGSSAAWIRMSVAQGIQGYDGSALPTVLNGDVPVMSIIPAGLQWEYRNGWYYCLQPVEAGTTSPAAFSGVHFAEQMGNEYLACRMQISFNVEAVQTANNGATVFEAAGW